MANIAIVSSDIVFNLNAEKLRVILDADGHVCTKIDDIGDLSTLGLAAYDCIIAAYITDTPLIAGQLRALIDNDGIPTMVVMWTTVAANAVGQTLLPTRMNLCGTFEGAFFFLGAPTGINITDNAHEITDAFPLGNLQTITVAENGAGIEFGQPFIGEDLALMQAVLDDCVGLVAIEEGTDDLDAPAVPTGARVVLAPFYVSDHNFTANCATLIEDCVTWLLTPPPPPPGGDVLASGLSVGLGLGI